MAFFRKGNTSARGTLWVLAYPLSIIKYFKLQQLGDAVLKQSNKTKTGLIAICALT